MEKCSDPELQEMIEETERLHTLWHKLHEYLEGHDKSIDDLSGWDDLKLMHDFCKDNPDVISVHIDDSYHCNAYLFIVPHESEKKYMGASVIVVPQCCGTNNQFFLYPGDNRGLLNACLRLEDKFQEKGDKRFVNDGDLNADDEDT